MKIASNNQELRITANSNKRKCIIFKIFSTPNAPYVQIQKSHARCCSSCCSRERLDVKSSKIKKIFLSLNKSKCMEPVKRSIGTTRDYPTNQFDISANFLSRESKNSRVDWVSSLILFLVRDCHHSIPLLNQLPFRVFDGLLYRPGGHLRQRKNHFPQYLL